MLECIVDDNQT